MDKSNWIDLRKDGAGDVFNMSLVAKVSQPAGSDIVNLYAPGGEVLGNLRGDVAKRFLAAFDPPPTVVGGFDKKRDVG